MKRFIAFAILVAVLGACSGGASDNKTTSTKPVPGSLPQDGSSAPPRVEKILQTKSVTDLDFLDTEHAFITEKEGYVELLTLSDASHRVVLDWSANTSTVGERGMLSLAIDPKDNKKVFINYTDNEGTSTTDEFTWNGTDIDSTSRRNVINVKKQFSNHNGGNLAFGADGYLYLALGDGGDSKDPQRNAQNTNTLLGKMLRIDPRLSGDQPYTIPSDNPFVGQAEARGEIWATGLRNPWRWSFDRENGDLWIGDVGQYQVEEVNHVTAAVGKKANFGWSAFEGNSRFNSDQVVSGDTKPVYTYTHGKGGCAVIGGFVYRGAKINSMKGRYIFGDTCTGKVSSLDPADYEVTELSLDVPQLSSFGQDVAGELYAMSVDGSIYRIVN